MANSPDENVIFPGEDEIMDIIEASGTNCKKQADTTSPDLKPNQPGVHMVFP